MSSEKTAEDRAKKDKINKASSSIFVYFILFILLSGTFYVFNSYYYGFEKLKTIVEANFLSLIETKSDSDLENEQKIEENLRSLENTYLPGPEPIMDIPAGIEGEEEKTEEIESQESKKLAQERTIASDKLNYEKLKEKLKSEVALHVSKLMTKIYIAKLENYRASLALSFELYQKYIHDKNYQEELDQLKSLELFKDFSSLFTELGEYNENYILPVKTDNPNLLEGKLAGKLISIRKKDELMNERNAYKIKIDKKMAEFLLYLYSDEFLTINFQENSKE